MKSHDWVHQEVHNLVLRYCVGEPILWKRCIGSGCQETMEVIIIGWEKVGVNGLSFWSQVSSAGAPTCNH